MAELKEAYTTKMNTGIVSVDDIDGTVDACREAVIQAFAAYKQRGFTSAKLTLTFKANISE